MNIWGKLHGGATHLPIVLLGLAALCEIIALFGDASLKPGLRAASTLSLIGALLGSIAGVVSGIIISNGQALGKENLLYHHLAVWPAFGLTVWLTYVRLKQKSLSGVGTKFFIGLLLVGAGLMLAAGYYGGEMIIQ